MRFVQGPDRSIEVLRQDGILAIRDTVPAQIPTLHHRGHNLETAMWRRPTASTPSVRGFPLGHRTTLPGPLAGGARIPELQEARLRPSVGLESNRVRGVP